MSFDVILPFLRPIENLLKDSAISEIMVNGPANVFIERDGQLEHVPGVSIPEKSLQVAVRNIARALGDEISEEKRCSIRDFPMARALLRRSHRALLAEPR